MKRGELLRYFRGLTVTQGEGVGKQIRVFLWQREFLTKAFRRGVRDAALSCGRGNGKTTFVSGVADAVLDGPLIQPRGEAIIIASSFEQARIDFEHALAFLEQKHPDLHTNKRWRIQASATWDRNGIFIEGDDKLLTVVSFFIMDEGRVPQQQGLPSKAIGILPLREGKDLCVLASYELERNFKSVVEKGVKRLFTNPRMIDPRAFAKALLSEGDSDGRFSACLTGDQPEGYAYLVMIPVGMK